MVNKTEISPLDFHQMLKRYSKGIATARICIFIFALFCLSVGVFHIFLYNNTESNDYSFVTSSLIYIILGLWSITKPFIPILIMAIILSVITFSALISVLAIHPLPLINLAAIMLIGFVSTVLIIRGAVFAWKKKKLISQL